MEMGEDFISVRSLRGLSRDWGTCNWGAWAADVFVVGR